LIIAIVWFGLLLRFAYLFLKDKHRLTNRRLFNYHGILWRTIDRIELIDVDDITYKQNPLQRLIGAGDINVYSSDVTTGDPEGKRSAKHTLRGIRNVLHVVEKIEHERREERRKRAIYTESV